MGKRCTHHEPPGLGQKGEGMKNQYFDKDYWAVVVDDNDMAWDIRRTKTEAIQAFVGPGDGYQKRWSRIKKWPIRHHIVRVTITWAEPGKKKKGK